MSTDCIELRLGDPAYPARLLHLADPPRVLYLRGRPELLNAITLGVVGSRDCSEYGVETTRLLVAPAVRAGAVVVSGMARGIDAVAHQTAFEAGGTTIAVFGCGIDRCYPASNRALYHRICEEGLAISEFAPGTKPYPYNFPHRNRVIARLSHALLVVEAAEKSGAQTTASHFGEFGDVLVVPGPLGRPTSVGTNSLIRDGCRIVLGPEDVLDQLGLEAVAPQDSLAPGLSAQARRVRAVLQIEPLHLDRISQLVNMEATDLSLALVELELGGFARALPGARYALARSL